MNETPRNKETSNDTESTSFPQQEAASSQPVNGSELEKLSGYLPELSASINRHDIYKFNEMAIRVGKLLETLAFTDLLRQLNLLHGKCVTAQDLVLNEIEIQDLIKALKDNSKSAGQA